MIVVVPVVCIVEGRGEEDAVRILVRRIFERFIPHAYPDVKAVIRRGRQKLVKPGELESAVELATLRLEGEEGIVLTLIDADDDCPKEVAPGLLARAVVAAGHVRHSVVMAVREYEAWFAAAAESLAGYRGLPEDLTAPESPETLPNPKAWLEDKMPDGYDPVIHQPSLTDRMDLDAARSAPSLDKLCRDLIRLAAQVEQTTEVPEAD